MIGGFGPVRIPLAAQGWQRYWLTLPANLRGALWVILSCLCVGSMAALVKSLGARLDSFELNFFRAAFGLLTVLPFALKAGPGLLRSRHPLLHLGRGIFGTLGMMSGYFALTRLPLADATAISFTAPLFLTILAALFLHETVRRRRWTATACGFLGMVIMLRPGEGALELAALVALIGAGCMAVVRLLVKQLAVTDKPLTIIVWFGLISAALSALPAAWVWRTPTLSELGLLVLLGCLASLTQVCMIRGYRIGEASALAPFEYFRLPFAAIYGYVLFAELPDLYSLLGAAIIVASTLYIAQREHRLGKRHAPPTDTAA